MKQSNRIEWLDGLRGLACILIFVHHFCLCFLPAIHFGESAPTYLWGFDRSLSQSPLSFLLNGNFLVAIFCTVSGVVISMQVIRMEDRERLSDLVAKRYFRLMLPLLPVAVAVFLLSNFGAFTNLEAAGYTGSSWAASYYRDTVSFGEMLQSAVVRTWFFGDDTLSTAFWMLSKLFFGTFLSVILSVIAWKYERHTWVIFAIVSIFLFGNSELLAAFALGTLLAWLVLTRQTLLRPVIGIPSLVLGLALGAFPSGVISTNFYRYLDFLTYVDWHILGAFLTLFGIFCCKIPQKILSAAPLRWLGKCSYAVYLIHIPLLFSLSTSFFLWLREPLGYLGSVGVSFAVSCCCLLLISCFYARYVERGCERGQGFFLNFFKKGDKK